MRGILLIAGIAGAVASGAALAHDGADHARARDESGTDATAFGRPGDPVKVTRTVKVGMSDTMRFSPSKLEAKAGEMEHAEAYMVRVNPA